ncbi:MAG: redoxin domain-containing protein [Deltaproteobacteria bacterium]|nr:MAG: redoxin domain-containing protein [Deltaproteobacteria bacterium]
MAHVRRNQARSANFSRHRGDGAPGPRQRRTPMRHSPRRGRSVGMKKTGRILLIATIATAIGASVEAAVRSERMARAMTSQAASSRAPTELSSLGEATQWLNSEPLTAAGLRGHVVLVDVWTFTCINWLRTMPHVRAWADKYKNNGLVVIGVHAPEFSFERNLDNVRRSAKELKVEYPIVIDNDNVIWRAFDNHYWPALYLIDAQGRIRHQQMGEGGYDQAETIIQQLLREAGSADVPKDLVSVDGRGIEAAADWGNLRSPENYLGFERSENFASTGGAKLGRRVYAAPEKFRLNQWALSGDWTVGKEAVRLNEAGGRISYRFHARDLHLVMGPASRGSSIRFRVRIDGRPPEAAHGGDVDEQGNGVAREQRLYQLIRQAKPIAGRTFEIEFLDPGVEGYSFTFG